MVIYNYYITPSCQAIFSRIAILFYKFRCENPSESFGTSETSESLNKYENSSLSTIHR